MVLKLDSVMFSMVACRTKFNDDGYRNVIKIYKAIILPVLLYDCETWPLTLKEEYRLRVFENRILRQIFGPKMDENGEWRRLHNEELRSLYHSPNIVRG